MRSIHFYLARLKNSSLPELIYRAKHFFFIKALKRKLQNNKNFIVVPKIDSRDIKELQLPSLQGQANKDLIGKILNGEVFTLNTDLNSIRQFEDCWRDTFFSDIKPFDQDTDIRSVWEPARLQHLTILLNHISRSGEASDTKNIKKFVKDSVVDWIHRNPLLLGPHYLSAMECGLRIPSLFYCLKVLDNLENSEYQLIFDTLYRHTWWVANRLSLYSSLGNHTIVEATGLIFGGAVFRKTAEGRRWLVKGHELLKRELDHQILRDGGPAEQSLNYHRFVLDQYWFAVDFLEKNKLYDCSDIKPRLTKGEKFLKTFENEEGNIPSIGDSDDGHTIAPGISPKRGKFQLKESDILTFPKSGYTVVKNNEIRMILNHGPLGMAPLYNHGHADALSIILSKDGKEILVDPGTYRYNGVPKWRKYFKGTRAHNTVTIDDQDQAVQETGFIWSHPYEIELQQNEGINGDLLLKASHNGYERLDEPVKHTRSIIFLDRCNFVVKDTFSGNGHHKFELNFHLHPDAVANQQDNVWWRVKIKEAEVFFRHLGEEYFQLIKGHKDQLLGWYSPSYGVKCESSVLSYSKSGSPKEVSFITIICTESPLWLDSIEERLFQIEQQTENS